MRVGKRHFFAFAVTGFAIGMLVSHSRGIPYIAIKNRWSIGIYMGTSPFNLYSAKNVRNPVLTASDITDTVADFVADPFMIQDQGKWYMFFEVMNSKSRQGDIGLAVSEDGFDFSYKQIVIDETFHLSYPYVFKWSGKYYMIPETRERYSVRLYESVEFPTQWAFVKTLLWGRSFVDSCIFRYDDRWCLFTTDRNDFLRLYVADDFMGSWTEHPGSPIVGGDAKRSRPAGRVIDYDGRIIRFAQDDEVSYGKEVRAFEIIELTSEIYKEKDVSDAPILRPTGSGWNGERMHHIDLHKIAEDKWLACVDGFGKTFVFGMKY